MKKILSFALVAAVGLGSMNVQAAQENEAVLAGKALIYRKKASKRAYILPILQIGSGILKSAFGAVAVYGSFIVQQVQRDAISNVYHIANERSDTSEALQNNVVRNIPVFKDIIFLGNTSKYGFRSLGTMVFLHGLIDVVAGLKNIQKVKSGLFIKFEDEKEEAQA